MLGGFCETLGRGHAERLVPMISELPGNGRADSILVSLGPGSFTGVRIGLAAARALGLAWQVPVMGYPTLALIAAMARIEMGAVPISVAVTGGHGEWFVQEFGVDGLPETQLASLKPEDAAAAARADCVAGSQAEALVALRHSGTALPLRPDARATQSLPTELLSSQLTPLYGRAPDAKVAQIKNKGNAPKEKSKDGKAGV